MPVSGWTVALQTVNFLILVWLLRHFLYRPVLAVIADREAAIARVRADADAARAQTEDARRAVDGERAEVAAERARLLAAAQAEAQAVRADLEAAARAEADRVTEDARARLERERRQALAGLKRHAVDLASTMADTILRDAARNAPAASFLRGAFEKLERLPGEERRRLIADGAAVCVTTADPLPPDDEQRVRERMPRVLGDPVTLTFATDPALIAGIEVRFPHAVLRYSWGEALARAQEELSDDDDPHRSA